MAELSTLAQTITDTARITNQDHKLVATIFVAGEVCTQPEASAALRELYPDRRPDINVLDVIGPTHPDYWREIAETAQDLATSVYGEDDERRDRKARTLALALMKWLDDQPSL